MSTDTLISFAESHPILLGFSAFVTLAILLVAYTTRPTTPEPNLPGPKGWPIVGNLFQRGSDPADTYHRWSKIYGPVFKVRLGGQWNVIINSAQAGDELLSGSTYASTFQSRPTGYSFHELIKHTTTKTMTVGSSPFDEVLKAKRRLALMAVNPAIAHNYEGIVHRVADLIVKSFKDASASGGPLDPQPIFALHTQHLSMGTHFALTPEEVDREWIKNLPFPMKRLTDVRATNGRLRDFLPFLRLFPESQTFREAVVVGNYRNKRLDELTDKIREKIAKGEADECTVKVMLDDEKNTLTASDLTSISNSMVSSGVDGHLAHAFLWALGILATHPEVQQKCVAAVHRRDAIGDASNIDKDKEDYMMAFTKEVFRMYTPFRLSLPRETMAKDVVWNGHVIPQGTTVVANVHSMNMDSDRFTQHEQFIPERFMKGPNADRAIAHYTFGQGRRMCPATQFVHNETYFIFSEIIRNFKIDLFDGEREFHPVKSCENGMSFSQGPKPFRITMQPRPAATTA